MAELKVSSTRQKERRTPTVRNPLSTDKKIVLNGSPKLEVINISLTSPHNLFAYENSMHILCLLFLNSTTTQEHVDTLLMKRIRSTKKKCNMLVPRSNTNFKSSSFLFQPAFRNWRLHDFVASPLL